MKTRKLFNVLTSIWLLSIQPIFAQDPIFQWAKPMGGEYVDLGLDVAVDLDGNVYTTGYFGSTAQFDPDNEDATLTSNGYSDIFIQKNAADGTLLWVRQIGGGGDDQGLSITVDLEGNVYTTGFFYSWVDFDPGDEIFNLSGGESSLFVHKMDTDGNFVWAKRMLNEIGYDLSIELDFSGNLLICGRFQGGVFDTGDDVDIIPFGQGSVFVLKMDPEGNLMWVSQVGGLFGMSLDLDGDGNVFIAGGFMAGGDFDPSDGEFYLTGQGEKDVFVLKLDSNGEFIWVKQIGGDSDVENPSIAVDNVGNVYLAAYFDENVDVDPGAGIIEFTSVGNFDFFVQKLDVDGDLVWAKQLGGTELERVGGIALDTSGYVYTTGLYKGTTDFNPGDEEAMYSELGDGDIYIQKLDTAGNFVWTQSIGGYYRDFGQAIEIGEDGSIYITGRFEGTADFDPGPEATNTIGYGVLDAFVLKLSQSNSVGIDEIELDPNVLVYPNPSSDVFNIEFENVIDDAVFTVTDIKGRLISTTQIQNAAKASLEIHEAPGIYLLTIKTKVGQKTIQLIKE